MPIVHVNVLAGRPQEKIEAMAKGVTDAVVAHLEVRPEAVRVVVHEIEPDHWFVAGAPKTPPK